jgi:hypothetical protein
VSKELRATLRELEEVGGDDDEFDRFLAGMSGPVVDG